MNQTIKKWGNGAALRLPSAIMAQAEFHLDATVEIHAERGRIVVEAVEPAGYRLDEMLAQIDADNRHEPVDWGPPRGREQL